MTTQQFDDMVAGTRQQLVTAPARHAVADADPRGAAEERAWERAHPAGRAEVDGDRLILWNYGVDDPDLKPEHRQALATWLAQMRWKLVRGTLSVTGHASATGAEARNVRLAELRARGVAFSLTVRHGVVATRVVASGAGESAPRGEGDTGEALARDRRVVVQVVMPPPVPDNPFGPDATGQPRPQPEPSQDPDWTAWLPATSVIVKIPLRPPVLVPLGAVGHLEVSGDVTCARFDPLPDQKTRVNYEFDGRLRLAAETWLQSDTMRLKLSGDRVGLGVKAGEILWEAELDTDARMPFTVAMTLPGAEETVILGVRVKVLQWKLRVRLVPSPATYQRLAQAGRTVATRLAPWAARTAAASAPVAVPVAVAVAYCGFVAWGFSQLDEAHRQGQEHAFVVNARHGYAMRIAAEVTVTPLTVYAADVESGAALAAAGRRFGWQVGGQGWAEMTQGERSALFSASGSQRHLPGPVRARIYTAIGGAGAPGPLPHPRDLAAMLTRRA